MGDAALRARAAVLRERIAMTRDRLALWRLQLSELHRSIDDGDRLLEGMLSESARVADAIGERNAAAAAAPAPSTDRGDAMRAHGEWTSDDARVAVACEQRRRPSMDDRYATARIDASTFAIVVCDGHGGAATSHVVAARLLAIVAEEWRGGTGEEQRDGEAGDALCFSMTHAFVRMEHELYAARATGGSTATVVVVTRDAVVTAHVGDTRAVLLERCGGGAAWTVRRDTLTRAHRGDDADEAARVQRRGGVIRDGRVRDAAGTASLEVTRAFGDFRFKTSAISGALIVPDAVVSVRPDVRRWRRTRDASLLVVVATDGYWDAMPDVDGALDAALRAATTGDGAPAAVARALLAASAASGTDNATVLVAASSSSS